jgi:hypothetical protein
MDSTGTFDIARALSSFGLMTAGNNYFVIVIEKHIIGTKCNDYGMCLNFL